MSELETPNDAEQYLVTCGLCGEEKTIATIAEHLVREHNFDPKEIVNAPVILDGSDDSD